MFEKKFLMSLFCLVVVLSFSTTATRGANILFVSSMTAAEDDALKAFMEGLGHTVTYIDDDEDEATTEAAAAAADLVFISESVGSSGIKNEITEIETPMIVGEPWAWDEMGLTEGSGGDDPGFSGTVAVLTDILAGCNVGKGIVGPEGTVIATATLSDGVTYDVIFVYEKGAALPVAPADGSAQVAADIRIGFGFHSICYPVLSDNAYALLGAAVDYALGLTGPPEPVDPDTLSGLADVTVVDGAIVSLRHGGTEYVVADGDLTLGTTTRWYIVEGVETLWVEGDPAPAATVPGTSSPKDGDVGSKADNFLFTLEGSTNISSIDGIDFQETIFPSLTDTIFVFERNGNDNGTVQAIMADGSLGTAMTLTKNGEPYASTGVDVNGQTAYGYVVTTGVPVQGVRITAAGHDTLSISTPTPKPVDPGTGALVAQYAMENDANDTSGNGLHGTLVGDPNFVEGLSGYGMALDFDGTDDLVELGTFDVFGQITLAAWIKADSFAINDARIISKAKEWGGNDHWWMVSTISETSLRFRLKTDDGQGTATLISDSVLEAGAWAHVAATWDGSMMRIYKDGAEVASQEKGGSAVAVDPNVSVAIGSQPSDAFATDPGHVAKFFDGLIDEVGIYHRALSPPEIRYLAGERAPVDPGTEALVAQYPLDNDANDASGNNHGTLSGDPQWVAGMIGGALQFDGVDDYVDCGNDPNLDITGPMTIAAWVYPTGSGSSNYPRIVDKSNGTGGADPGYKIYLRAAQDYLVTVSAGGTYLNSSTSAVLDTWNYVAFTITGAKWKLCLNGTWEEWDESTLPSSSTNPLVIGNSPAGARHFNGIIDEVVIYNRALSEPEVRYLAGDR
ncbi:MAG: LamG domain-containing protein [Planctomycetota bacterium]|jgi:hypothetical protein